MSGSATIIMAPFATLFTTTSTYGAGLCSAVLVDISTVGTAAYSTSATASIAARTVASVSVTIGNAVAILELKSS